MGASDSVGLKVRIRDLGVRMGATMDTNFAGFTSFCTHDDDDDVVVIGGGRIVVEFAAKHHRKPNISCKHSFSTSHCEA